MMEARKKGKDENKKREKETTKNMAVLLSFKNFISS
jgi:hypothetical protein